MRWLQSGLRRDICALVAGLDEPTGQQVKAALERHYDERIRPKTFHGALDALAADGFLERRRDGLADRYALTAAGRQAIEQHYAWLGSILDAGAPVDTARDEDD